MTREGAGMRRDEFPIVDKLVKDSINEELDKIRNEIEAEMNDLYRQPSIDQRTLTIIHACQRHIAIIDKYREEQE